MERKNIYENKNVLVCGLARSGAAAAKLLSRLGARVTVCDLRNADQLQNEIGELNENIKIICGKNPDDVLLNETDLIILSPGIPSDAPFVTKAKNKKIRVISEIELAFSVCNAPVIAVTGTNGKTTTSVLTGKIFESKYETAVLGNVGEAFSKKAADISPNGVAVVETSSFQLENIETYKPKAAIILNITPDHLDRHKTLAEYVRIKKRIFEKQKEDDYLILNYDDPLCAQIAAEAKSKVIYFSNKTVLNEGVFLENGLIISNINGAREEIVSVDELMIRGHLIDNALAACAAAVLFNVSVVKIADTLRGFKGVEHRLEYVAEINGVEYFNDSKATNPDAAIKGLSSMTRPVLLICGGSEKNLDFTEWTALFKNRVKKAFVIGETADKIIGACEKNNFFDYEKVKSLEEAVKKCVAAAEPGDAALLSPACASWDMFRDFEERGSEFKKFVKEHARM